MKKKKSNPPMKSNPTYAVDIVLCPAPIHVSKQRTKKLKNGAKSRRAKNKCYIFEW